MKVDDIFVREVAYIPRDGVFTGDVRIEVMDQGLLKHDDIVPSHVVIISVRVKMEPTTSFVEVETALKAKAHEVIAMSVAELAS